MNIRQRVQDADEIITKYYCVHDDRLFIKVIPYQESWKLVIPPAVENKLILDYHVRYGHMGAIKIVKALEEQVYICLLYTSRCV